MNSEGIEKRCLVACHQDLIDQGLCQCNKKITMNDKTRTTEEIVEQVWNSITSNGCREMDEVRFEQACLEFKQLILNGRKSNEEIRERIVDLLSRLDSALTNAILDKPVRELDHIISEVEEMVKLLNGY